MGVSVSIFAPARECGALRRLLRSRGDIVSIRRFPPLWSLEDIGGYFVVKASNGPAAGIHLLWKAALADHSRGY